MAKAWHDELHDRKLALYHLGLNDIEIGQDVGRDPRSIRLWRKRHSLVKQKRKSVRPVSPDEEAKRLELYGAGRSDADIAAMLGLTPCAIQSWRNRRGLIANFCAGGNPSNPALVPITPDVKRRCFFVLKLGVSAKTVANESGIALTTLNKWRARIVRDEPELRKTSFGRLKERVRPSGRKYGKLRGHRLREAFDLYCDGNTDAEIAHELGLDRSRIGEWRAALQLPLIKKLRTRGSVKRMLRHLGPAITPLSNPIHAQIMAALGRGIAADLIDDAASDMWLAIAEGRLSPHDIAKHAKSYRGRVVTTYADSHKQRSLDEDIGDGDGFRMIDLIRDERSSSWLERSGATVW